MRFWLGGYTADMDGHAGGIGVLTAGEAAEQSPRGSLAFVATAAHAESPSWVSTHPTLDVVYAALESRGVVQAFRRTGAESLVAFGEPVITGDLTCHVAAAPAGDVLVAASYGDGTVTRIKLAEDGSMVRSRILAEAMDPYALEGANPPAGLGTGTRLDGAASIDLAAAAKALREAAGTEFAHLVPEYDQPVVEEAPAVVNPDARVSRAHETVFLSDELYVTTDLGFDLVRFWRGSSEVQSVALPKGTGPRHAVFHPSGHLYVVTEYSAEVYALAADRDGTWRIITATSVSRETAYGTDAPAEITQTADGLFLHVSVRGSNALATLAVRDGGARLENVALVEAGVDWPRHHVAVDDLIFVAGQRSDDVVSLGFDTRTGVIGRVQHRSPAPSPTVITPIWD